MKIDATKEWFEDKFKLETGEIGADKLSPTFDSDHYPSDESLEIIKNWGYENDFFDLMDYVEECWSYPDFFTKEKTKDDLFKKDIIRYEISTGGWSGNESIIRALQENTMFWAFCWAQSWRGGHYIFELRLNEGQ